MKVAVKESMVVKPVEETPSGSVWLSNLDLLMPIAYYSRLVFFFRYTGAPDFFDAAALKAALSNSLVHFYPYAGRLGKDHNGRLHINCNAEGALFLLAECDASLHDLSDFTPRADVTLVPKIDSSHPISSWPLLLLQLTRFRCGGVCIGFTSHHHLADGFAALHFMNTWSEIARGLTPTAPPFMDRRLLSARSPPQPQFPHMEYQLPPSLDVSLDMSETSCKIFSLSAHHIAALHQNCKHQTTYTRYRTITGHVWRTVCMARRLPSHQQSSLRLPVDSRPRLRPPLPPRFFGNAAFYTTAVASCGEIEGNPLGFTVGKVHEAVAQMEGDYMRSAVDYLELQMPKSQSVVRNVRCPNFGMTNWIHLPFYETDFGWGKPVFAGPGAAPPEGKSYVFVDPQNEGGVLFVITLLKPHMELFQKLLYDI